MGECVNFLASSHFEIVGAGGFRVSVLFYTSSAVFIWSMTSAICIVDLVVNFLLVNVRERKSLSFDKIFKARRLECMASFCISGVKWRQYCV